MILTTDKEFADAVKSGLKIKKKTIYYTGKLEQEPVKGDYKLFYYVKDKGIYVGLIYDENGENPKKLFIALKDAPEKMTWDEAIRYDFKGYRLPTIRELSLIHMYKDAINAALKKHGGKPLEDDWYWSSTEYSSNYAWGLGFLSGTRGYGSKSVNGYVRPVLAF